MGREGDEIKLVRNEIKQRRMGIAAQTTRREPQTAQISPAGTIFHMRDKIRSPGTNSY
jgi:hypothetical protein